MERPLVLSSSEWRPGPTRAGAWSQATLIAHVGGQCTWRCGLACGVHVAYRLAEPVRPPAKPGRFCVQTTSAGQNFGCQQLGRVDSCGEALAPDSSGLAVEEARNRAVWGQVGA